MVLKGPPDHGPGARDGAVDRGRTTPFTPASSVAVVRATCRTFTRGGNFFALLTELSVPARVVVPGCAGAVCHDSPARACLVKFLTPSEIPPLIAGFDRETLGFRLAFQLPPTQPAALQEMSRETSPVAAAGPGGMSWPNERHAR